MSKNNLIAEATVRIDAPPDEVWEALVDPAAIEQYMFGAKVKSDWREGSPITWQGEWNGTRYEDKGEILEMDRGRRLRYTHYSPLSKLPDVPESYHRVTIDLEPAGDQTAVALTQDRNQSEEDRDHSAENWRTMLDGLKKYVES